MSEDIMVTVLCKVDWELLFPRLRKIAAGYLKKKGVDEHDMQDITNEWLEKLYRCSRYPVYNALGYATRALARAHINWCKKHTKDCPKNVVDISEISEEMPSDDMTPLDLVLDWERNVAMIRVMNLLVDYMNFTGNISDARLLYTLLSVMRKDGKGIISCCVAAAERLQLDYRDVYTRFRQLCRALKIDLQQSEFLKSWLNDDLDLIGLADHASPRSKAAA